MRFLVTGMFRRSGATAHVDDTTLVAVASAGGDLSLLGDADRDHLDVCQVCRDRVADVSEALGQWADEAAGQADACFSAERLEHQRDAILRRVALDGRPARVIAFPARHGQTPGAHRVARRWVAAAAAAGLCVGLLTGRALVPTPVSLASRTPASLDRAPASRPLVDPSLRQAAIGDPDQSDEAFLAELDVAVMAPRIAPLEALDALTPQHAGAGPR